MNVESRQVTCHIRWMIRRDMPEVFAIEHLSHEHPWTEDDFLRCLRQRNCIGMIAEEHGRDPLPVLGFMVYELHKSKLHVLNLAVHPAWRRREVGRQLVLKLASKLSDHRRTRLTLHTRETNLAAQLFLRTQGFRAVRVLPGFYDDTAEDAFLIAVPARGGANLTEQLIKRLGDRVYSEIVLVLLMERLSSGRVERIARDTARLARELAVEAFEEQREQDKTAN